MITADCRRIQRLPGPSLEVGTSPASPPRPDCEITVCHYPPGTSKWNKIEHRLFSFISMNWRGRPLTDIRTIVELIAATTTTTGLTVQAAYDPELVPHRRQDQRHRTRHHPPHPPRLARRMELHDRSIKPAVSP